MLMSRKEPVLPDDSGGSVSLGFKLILQTDGVNIHSSHSKKPTSSSSLRSGERPSGVFSIFDPLYF
jgi:hypothetical protein